MDTTNNTEVNNIAIGMNAAAAPTTANTQGSDEVPRILRQLEDVDFSLTNLSLELKDPKRRQVIGSNLVNLLKASIDRGTLEFSDIKFSTKSGNLNLKFKLPISSLQ